MSVTLSAPPPRFWDAKSSLVRIHQGVHFELQRRVIIVARQARSTGGQLTLDEELSGDCWKKHSPVPDMQINIMNSRAIAVVAGTTERWRLAGDQLFVGLDFSETNLPVGTRLELGSALIEVTAPPHTGCNKFAARFGTDAAKFVNSREGDR